MSQTSRGARANGLDSEWLEILVKNVKDELQRQVARVVDAGAPKPAENKTDESATGKADSAEENNWKTRAGNARTLAVLTGKLERLEQQLAKGREIKVRRHEDAARKALERRLDKLLDGGAAGSLGILGP